MSTTTTLNDSILPTAPPAPIVEAEIYEEIAREVVTLTRPHTAAAEQFRVLRYRLEVLAKGGIKALVFTSAQGGEGRTTCAVNAALAVGRGRRNKVVLVDGDLRRPGVHTMLGLRPRQGLCDVVAGRAPLGGCLWRFGDDELYVLPAGSVPDDLGDTLYDPRLGQLLAELRERFDFVIVDAPPVLPLADVPTLCLHTDGAVMVVRANATARELVAAAIDGLYGVTVHGIVLNDLDPRAATTLRLHALDRSKALMPPRT